MGVQEMEDVFEGAADASIPPGEGSGMEIIVKGKTNVNWMSIVESSEFALILVISLLRTSNAIAGRATSASRRSPFVEVKL